MNILYHPCQLCGKETTRDVHLCFPCHRLIAYEYSMFMYEFNRFILKEKNLVNRKFSRFEELADENICRGQAHM